MEGDFYMDEGKEKKMSTENSGINPISAHL
jgi:hypothetical protein